MKIITYICVNKTKKMNIEKFKKLKEAIEVNTFEQSYVWIAKISFGFAILSQFAGISFGYIFLHNLIADSTDGFWGKAFTVPLIALLCLSSFELLKRFVIRRTTLNWYITRRFNKEVLGTFVVSVLLIALTFFLTLSGAKDMGDRSKTIESHTENKINLKTDSIAKLYDTKIALLQKDKDTYLQMITAGTKSRELRGQYNALIETANTDIKALEADKEAKIKEYQSIENTKASVKQKDVKKNIISFLILSTCIELFILLGVWFHTYFDYKTYQEFNERVSSQSNYKKFLINESLLELIYNKGKVKIGDVLNNTKHIKKLAGIKGVNVTDKQLDDFFILTKHLKITETVSNKRIVDKSYDEARLIISDYYNV